MMDRYAVPSAAGDISTVAAGVGGPGWARTVSVANVGDNGKGPCGVSYGSGRLYIADSGSVRSVNQRTGWLTTPAGTGSSGPLGDGGPAASANLFNACGVVVDHQGNLVIGDGGDNRVRVVAARTGTFYGQAMTAGHIYPVAGNGTIGPAGNGGLATKADVTAPDSVAVDGAGNLVIGDGHDSIPDQGGDTVRVVAHRAGTFYGQAMKAGHIYAVAGDGTAGYSGDGGLATATELWSPQGVAVDGAGNLLIADTGNRRIRVVAARTGMFYGRAMTAGHIYTVAGDGTPGFSGDGGPATAAELWGPRGVAVDGAGNLLIADARNHRIRVVAASTGMFYGQAMTAGDIYTVAGDGTHGSLGDGGPATAAELKGPAGVAVDGAGNLVIADRSSGRVRVVAATSGMFYGEAMTAGDIYAVAGNGTAGFSGGGAPARSAEFFYPGDMAVDGAGNLLIADTGDNRIWVVAHAAGTFYGRAMTAGDVYAVAGDGVAGFSGDGGRATAAELNDPRGVATGSAGNLLIADSGNQRVRVVAAATGMFYGRAMTAGHIYTVAGDGVEGFSGDGGPATAAKLLGPQGVLTDSAGNLLIADTSNGRVRVVAAATGTFYRQAMTAGDIYTIAGDGNTLFSGDGGPATSAGVDPQCVAVDGAGNLVIADQNNDRVRVVADTTGTFYGRAMTAGDIYTVAGDGTSGFSGDGGPATAAELSYPDGLAVDGAGNLVIADQFNDRVRVVADAAGTFYGRAMTAGDIYTVAGDGTSGFSGDGGPAAAAELAKPEGLAVDGSGNLLIADTVNDRIRQIAG
jgi:hypothetical protein